MDFQIEIKEGHASSAYFWIHPVIILNCKDTWGISGVEKLPDEVSIDEENVSSFLSYFFKKYFDDNLSINQSRIDFIHEGEIVYVRGFEWYLVDNFYTYDTMHQMLDEISKIADMLENDYDNDSLKPIIEEYSICLMIKQGSRDYNASKEVEPQLIKANKHIVIDFYRRFVNRITKMMENNPRTDIISINGP